MITKVLAVARRRPMLVVASAVCLAITLGAGLRLWSGQGQNPAIAADPAVIADAEAEAEAFEKATVSVSWRLQSLSPQYLFPSTPKSERESGIIVGRADPYAPISRGRPAPRPQTKPTAAVNTSPTSTLPPAVAAAPTALPPIPFSNQPLATLPPLPTAVAPAPLAPLAAPVAASRSPIDALQLTGVVQLGNRSALIVREPNTTTSRYTYAGDYLAGGQVLVKHIDISNQEPLVILEYNGREYSRMVGSGPLASLR